jgi:hypothetical protein
MGFSQSWCQPPDCRKADGANHPIARPENLFAKKCKQGLTTATIRFNADFNSNGDTP